MFMKLKVQKATISRWVKSLIGYGQSLDPLPACGKIDFAVDEMICVH